MTSPLLAASDKSFWHGYIPFYESRFPEDIAGSIIEFGVFRGNSIRWLLERFPSSRIFGVDILPIQPEWPVDPRVRYVTLDQGDEAGLVAFFREREGVALILEDGSHLPLHQALCLKHGFRALSPGGLYVLEDVHTSHPAHSLFRATCLASRSTALSVLLAIDHLKRIGVRELPLEAAAELDDGGVLGAKDIQHLFAQAETISLYRRTHLPDACFRCGSNQYDYHRLRCTCGEEIFAEADSMSFVIRKRA